MAKNLDQYYCCSSLHISLLSLSSLVLVIPWSSSHALPYMKFNLSSTGLRDDRPYLAYVFIGTPPQMMGLAIDMGSDLVRFTCGVKEGENMPPAGTQKDTMTRGDDIPSSGLPNLAYNVNESSTFLHVFCNLPGFCPTRFQANRPDDDCSNETYCILPSDKPDRSNNMYLSMDNLNMNGRDSNAFIFACDPYDYQEIGRSTRGVLGLGRREPSLFQDFSPIYDYCLSYCLPNLDDSTSTGYLAFGLVNGKCPGGDDTSNLVLTDLSSVHPNYPSSYLINITSINIGPSNILINSSSDQIGILVNPATFFTTLPSEVYKAMRDIFLEKNNSTVLNDYTFDDGELDLCFNTSNGAAPLKIPRVLMTFTNDATVDLDQLGIIYVVDETISCLGFKGNGDPNSPGVLGGMQQAKLEVGIDVANNKVGFRPTTACW